MRRLRTLRVIAVAAGLFSSSAGLGFAQEATSAYPSRTIRFIVGAAPGGGVDAIARLMADKLSKSLRTAVVVENLSGAQHNIAHDHVAKAKPDGYTFAVISPTFAINAASGEKLPFDSLKDFKRVTLISRSPNMVLTNPQTGFKSIRDVIEWGKARPGELNIGYGGTQQELLAKRFAKAAGIEAAFIPYDGAGAQLTALLSKEIDLSMSTTTAAGGFVRSGQLVGLAIASDKRTPIFPELPSTKEAGIDFLAATWYGMLAPAGTPDGIITKLQQAVAAAVKEPDVVTALEKDGAEPVASDPASFDVFMKREIEQLRKN